MSGRPSPPVPAPVLTGSDTDTSLVLALGVGVGWFAEVRVRLGWQPPNAVMLGVPGLFSPAPSEPEGLL